MYLLYAASIDMTQQLDSKVSMLQAYALHIMKVFRSLIYIHFLRIRQKMPLSDHLQKSGTIRKRDVLMQNRKCSFAFFREIYIIARSSTVSTRNFII